MLNISAIILTYNEEIHIERCINNVSRIAKEIFIIDSYSTDNTIEIAKSLGARVYQNKWEKSYSKQFNWALKNCDISTKWILRIDADEYLTDELINELYAKFEKIPDSVSGIEIPLKRIFMGHEIKRGIKKSTQVRFFKYGKAECEQRCMDEHIIIQGGVTEFHGAWVDNNLSTIGQWITKHNGYAERETIDLLINNYAVIDKCSDMHLTKKAAIQRKNKLNYSRMPLFWRAFFYFCFRYIVKGGFLDGKEGFLWHFLQGWWYRTLVDAKILEIKKHCGEDKEKTIEYIRQNYKIEI